MLLGLHFLLPLLVAPGLFGLIAKTKALVAGRRGPPLLQVYRDLNKLLRKGTVYSHTASWVLPLAPVVNVALLILCIALLPGIGAAPLHFSGDLLLFLYALGLARCATLLAAFDVGSSFEGMGASREATFGALSELAAILGFITLAILTHATSLDTILSRIPVTAGLQPILVLLALIFFLILLTENSRLPIDDPTTHLELTMIHEVMVLDYGGVDLALIELGRGLKLFLFLSVVAGLWWPQPTYAPLLAAGWLLVKMGAMAIGVGLIESGMARWRLVKIPQLLMANFVMAVFALLVTLLTL
ncbi:MAG: NADH-quinone oxidoreductase subunit H [Deltaproteobacteria bacterium]|nr:NADH-quinone oxidoreductase subunit H [Deltaproteobacteria bacterium]